MNDEGYRLFLNTHGTDDENISSELKAMLEFFENPTEEVAAKSDSTRIKRMQKRVTTLKNSEELGAKYMREWEERAIERQEGKAEGESRRDNLYKALKAANRLHEFEESIDNSELRNKLYEEFKL